MLSESPQKNRLIPQNKIRMWSIPQQQKNVFFEKSEKSKIQIQEYINIFG